MKQIYIPTKEELLELSKYEDTHLYKYLLAKVVEKMLVNHIYINKIDDSLKDIKEIVDSICYIYPQDIFSSIVAKNSEDLCLMLLDKHPSDEIYILDNLAKFNHDVLTSYNVTKNVIKILNDKLPSNPEYRFTYKNNELLDDIFTVNYKRFIDYPNMIIDKLIAIDPIYILKLPSYLTFTNIIDTYSNRFGIPHETGDEYIGKNIIKNPDIKVKKLINYLYK